jgi:hypothetical protein
VPPRARATTGPAPPPASRRVPGSSHRHRSGARAPRRGQAQSGTSARTGCAASAPSRGPGWGASAVAPAPSRAAGTAKAKPKPHPNTSSEPGGQQQVAPSAAAMNGPVQGVGDERARAPGGKAPGCAAVLPATLRPGSRNSPGQVQLRSR